MNIQLDNQTYQVNVIKKNNRNTYIRVKNGVIVVTTNYLTPKSSITKLIMDNRKSIKKMIEMDKKKMDKSDKFYYFGKEYKVVYGFRDMEITSDHIYVLNKSLLDKYINKEMLRIYRERLDYWYNIFEESIPIPNLKIRKMTSRWGVCNIKNHNVTLNSALISYDISCLDYVIVHELSHFIFHDHSKQFWLLVYKYYPNYKKCRKMLKE